MPKEPRAKEVATPKKRSRKAKPAPVNGTGTEADRLATTLPPAITQQTASFQSLEDKIRERAYQLYLQRNGNGGSPEQDWLRAQQEICGKQSVA